MRRIQPLSQCSILNATATSIGALCDATTTNSCNSREQMITRRLRVHRIFKKSKNQNPSTAHTRPTGILVFYVIYIPFTRILIPYSVIIFAEHAGGKNIIFSVWMRTQRRRFQTFEMAKPIQIRTSRLSQAVCLIRKKSASLCSLTVRWHEPFP